MKTAKNVTRVTFLISILLDVSCRPTTIEAGPVIVLKNQDMFICVNGIVILTRFTCDGVNDCGDNSDEKVCSDLKFKCKIGKTIPRNQTCDHNDDCGDNSDETYCDETCESYHMKCDNGKCVNRLWFCNTNEDCSDGTEARICHKETCPHFLFKKKCEGNRTICLGTQYLCDGVQSGCFGDSDEIFCKDSKNCPPTTFQCENGGCVSFWKICDGKPDCKDETDELYCPGSYGGLLRALDQVPEDKFDCGAGRLIPARWKCDGLFHCDTSPLRATDEIYCKGEPKPPEYPKNNASNPSRGSRVSFSALVGYCLSWMGQVGTVVDFDNKANIHLVSWENGRTEIVKSSDIKLCSKEGDDADVWEGTHPRIKSFFHQADLKVKRLQSGKLVVPGKHWNWGNQHNGGTGTVIDILKSHWTGWIVVRWSNNLDYVYRYGAGGKFDVELVEDLDTRKENKTQEMSTDDESSDRSNASCSHEFIYNSSYSFDQGDVAIGVDVVPGPNWTYCDHEEENAGKGVIISIPSNRNVNVMWGENGPVRLHAFGHNRLYEVALIDNPMKFIDKFKEGEQVKIIGYHFNSLCGKEHLNKIGVIKSFPTRFSVEVAFKNGVCVFNMGKGGIYDLQRANIQRRPNYEEEIGMRTTYLIIGSAIIGGCLIILIICGLCVRRYGRSNSARINRVPKLGGGGTSTAAVELEQLPLSEDHVINPADLDVDTSQALGSGQFGTVFSGRYKGMVVAIKTINNLEDANYLNQFLDEIRIIKKIGEHANIVKFYGAEISNLASNVLRIVLELSPLGDMLTYLRANSSNPCLKDVAKSSIKSKGPRPLPMISGGISVRQLFSWAEQIAQGMSHLQDRNIVHGDLAARNVLVFLDGVVKLSDFGLSRSLYQYTIYEKKNLCPLPWRWLALESLQAFEFSSKSDVWAYGVTLWEIFTHGLLPFPQQSWTKDFETLLIRGHRLEKPELAPPNIYEKVMLPCWYIEPSHRPDFHHILQLLAANKGCISKT